MPAYVHVAKILPGKRDEFAHRIKTGMEAAPEALRALGFTRIISFTTTETVGDDEALLVTVYEADDPAVVERFYALEPVIEQEHLQHGTLVHDHDHDVVSRNEAFVDLRLRDD
jgi:hypothetical protein